MPSRVVGLRRWFHQHAELSFQEHDTAAFIAEQLKTIGIDVQEGVGRTGVVGLLVGGLRGPCIGIRADMDALPIQETTGLEFASKNAGVMHACGHDAHMAMLLYAAEVLVQHRERIKGSVKFIFQPAEEGHGGAAEMIRDGVLENPHVEQIYGLHVWNYIEAGLVAIKKGNLMAACGSLEIVITGKGGHGAAPQGTRDCIVAGAHLVTQLQAIVSRNINPLDSAVVTIGTFQSGYNGNVIADQAVLRGTLRAFSNTTYSLVEQRVKELCAGVEKSFGVQVDMKISSKYPVTRNVSEECIENLRKAARDVVPDDQIIDPEPTMAAEDFSHFLEQRPGCFYFLGSMKEKPIDGELGRPHHKSNFDIDEDILERGAAIWVRLVLNLLG